MNIGELKQALDSASGGNDSREVVIVALEIELNDDFKEISRSEVLKSPKRIYSNCPKYVYIQ